MAAIRILVTDARKTWKRGRVEALRGVSLSVARGCVTGLVGPNGAGKSTLLDCLMGFTRLDGGEVTLDGWPSDSLEARGSTGWLPQGFPVEPRRSGRAILGSFHGLAGHPRFLRDRDVTAALDSVGLSAAEAARSASQYSGGMRQRLGIAQAFLGQPGLLMLDEPTTGLDPVGLSLLRDMVAGARARGAAVLMSSHQLDEIERTCDDVVFLSRGLVANEPSRDAAATARVVIAVFSSLVPPPDQESLARAAALAGASVLGIRQHEARFEVADDAATSALLGSLVEQGHAPIELRPAERALERAFLSHARRDA